MDYENNKKQDEQTPSANDYSGPYQYDDTFHLDDQKDASTFPAPNGFASAALVMGILSLVLCCCCYISIPLGGLGILFAILSRTSRRPMHGPSRTGLILSVIGLCLTFLLTISVVASYMNNADLQRQFRDYMEYYTGNDFNNNNSDNSGSRQDFSFPDYPYDDTL